MYKSACEDGQAPPFHFDRHHILFLVVDSGQLLVYGLPVHYLHPTVQGEIMAPWNPPEATVAGSGVLEWNPESQQSVGLAEHVAGILVSGDLSAYFGRF